MMENIMNAVNAVMSACRESLNHTNDDYERVTILVSRVGWVQVLNDAQVMKPECLLWVVIPAVRQSPLSVRLGSDRSEQPAPVTIRLPASAFRRVFP